MKWLRSRTWEKIPASYVWCHWPVSSLCFEVDALHRQNKWFQPWVNLKGPVSISERRSDALGPRFTAAIQTLSKQKGGTDRHLMQIQYSVVEQHHCSSSQMYDNILVSTTLNRPYSFRTSWLHPTDSCCCLEGFDASLRWNNGFLNHAWNIEIL